MVTGFPGGTVVKKKKKTKKKNKKKLPADARDTGNMGLIPGSGRSPGKGNGNLLQYPMYRGAWQATVHVVAELDTTEPRYVAYIHFGYDFVRDDVGAHRALS